MYQPIKRIIEIHNEEEVIFMESFNLRPKNKITINIKERHHKIYIYCK